MFGVFVNRYGADIQLTGDNENQAFDFQTDDKNAKMQAFINARRATYKDLKGMVFEQRKMIRREVPAPSTPTKSVASLPHDDTPKHDDEDHLSHHHHETFSMSDESSRSSKKTTREDKHH